MNIAALALRNRVTTLVLTLMLIIGGISSYNQLSRLEDPEFTIKEALVITPYPGASAAVVQEEVSDKIELAVQQLGQLMEVESRSVRGLSTVTVRIKKKYRRGDLPQIWDELRRKVNDVQDQLPPGAGPSQVNDDYGDVWGVFFALYGSEYSYAELKETAKLLRRELSLVKDVAKVELWGDRTEAVYVVPDRDRMAQLGIKPGQITRNLRDKNIVVDAGRAEVGTEFIAISPTGTFSSVQDFENLLISGEDSDRQIYLRDVASVKRGYVEPQTQVLRYDGNLAIGIGISTVSGGNVVTMGKAIEARLQELAPQIPLGVQLGVISLQSEAVTTAIDGFLNSLMQAVVIVVAVLLVFMGLRSGLIIGFILALTIIGTFIFMGSWGVALERISLGALIIALGMLVDNAIVVVDGMLVRIAQGEKPEEAAQNVVKQTALPLLGATAVAIMAFGAIGLSDDSTGEFCKSLFQVVLISLSLSWVTAVTVTPLLGVMFLKAPKQKPGEARSDPYAGGLYRVYRRVLRGAIRVRWVTVTLVLAAFAAALWGFRYVDQSFFPDSTRPQFMVDLWLPQGTYIDDTLKTAESVEAYLLGVEGVKHVSTLAGAGGLRFMLTYAPEKVNSAYAQFLVDVDDYRKIDTLIPTIEQQLAKDQPNALAYGKKFLLGPGEGGKIQIRFSGPDPAVLRQLAGQAEHILRHDGAAKAIRTDWREPVPVVEPVLAEAEANLAGITREVIATTVRAGFEGEATGVYREGDELLPIIFRAAEAERSDISSIQNLQVWAPAAGQYVPLRQVVSKFDTRFQNAIIQRLNRKPTITVHADPATGLASELLERIRPQVEALPLGADYELQWWGEYKSSREGQQGIAASVPFFFVSMVLIVIALFNALRQPLIIWLTVPLALIGVTAGLLLTKQPFGFMALLGFMSLSGMLIKNAVVLIDEMELQKRSDKPLFDAIVDSGVSRLRPVSMAALTTALGLIPLLLDAFFVSMAVTIIFGLMVATVLTMVVVPVLYAIFFRVPYPERETGVTPGRQ
jgi:multidrug efflux pump subunit AcrB